MITFLQYFINIIAGGRGMNLGIEDAWILAGMIKTNKTDEFTNLRLGKIVYSDYRLQLTSEPNLLLQVTSIDYLKKIFCSKPSNFY